MDYLAKVLKRASPIRSHLCTAVHVSAGSHWHSVNVLYNAPRSIGVIANHCVTRASIFFFARRAMSDRPGCGSRFTPRCDRPFTRAGRTPTAPGSPIWHAPCHGSAHDRHPHVPVPYPPPLRMHPRRLRPLRPSRLPLSRLRVLPRPRALPRRAGRAAALAPGATRAAPADGHPLRRAVGAAQGEPTVPEAPPCLGAT